MRTRIERVPLTRPVSTSAVRSPTNQLGERSRLSSSACAYQSGLGLAAFAINFEFRHFAFKPAIRVMRTGANSIDKSAHFAQLHFHAVVNLLQLFNGAVAAGYDWLIRDHCNPEAGVAQQANAQPRRGSSRN